MLMQNCERLILSSDKTLRDNRLLLPVPALLGEGPLCYVKEVGEMFGQIPLWCVQRQDRKPYSVKSPLPSMHSRAI